MVINSIYINKTSNHLSTENKPQKNITYDVGNSDPSLGQAQKCGAVESINGIPTLPS